MSQWYAVQVQTGREEKTLAQFLAFLDEVGLSDAVEEAFVPKRVIFERVGRAFAEKAVPLFPGYLIIVARKSNLADVQNALRSIPAFARMLTFDGVFMPLAREEVAIICTFTGQEGHVIGTSQGFVEGGKVVVVSGPLVGREAMVKKVNRRKRTARVEISFCGRLVETELALALMRSNKELGRH